MTITKSITINCLYTEGGVLAAGNGITVNAAATDVIVLRGLDIFGVNPPTHGVRILAGGAVHIEESTIRRFNSAGSFGVSFQPSGNTNLYITNTTITGNGSGGSGGGINIQPTGSSGSGRVFLEDVRLINNANVALRVDTTGNTAPFGVVIDVDDTEIIGNAGGIAVNTPAGTSAAVVMVSGSNVSHNSGTAIAANGLKARIRVGASTITGNSTGVALANGAIINTYGDNRLDGNGTDGTFTAPPLAPK